MVKYALVLKHSRGLPGTTLLLALALPIAMYGQQRALKPADLARLELLRHRYSSFTISPDGELLAFVVERPKLRSTPGSPESLLTEERCDVWLTSLSTFKTWNVTNGIATAAGFFMPTWSPDGQYLAMVSSSRNSDKVVVWERRNGRVRDVVNQAVDYWYANEPSIVWSSEENLLCFLRPQGRRQSGIEGQRLSADTATREWRKSWQGKESTASVLDSGVEPSLTQKTALTRFNVRTGKAETLAQGTFRNLQLSPDRKHIAFFRQTGKFLPNGHPLTSRSFRRYTVLRYQLEIMDQNGARLTPKSFPFMNPDSMGWSHSGRNLSVVAEDPNSPEGTLWTYQLDIQSRSIRKLYGETVEDSTALWVGEEAVVQTIEKGNSQTPSSGQRDWWITSSVDGPTNLTKTLLSPSNVVELDAYAVLASAGGELWQISSDRSSPKKIKTDLDGIKSIVWSKEPSQVTRRTCRLIVQTQNQHAPEFYLIDVASGKKLKFPTPEQDATLVAYDQNKTAVFTASNRTGTYLWLAEAGQTTARLVYESNQFLRDIAEGQRQQIEYRSLDRKALKAWIVLPPNYEKGKRYPVVTWVYPGTVLGDDAPHLTNLNFFLPLNLQLYAARGFVVLVPSIPLDPSGQISDTYVELQNGVLPAIDRLIDLGIADPDRLAVAGHSWGGYATLALVTQTRRFKAAIAYGGVSDYFSFHTEFDLPHRYLDDPLEFPRAMVDLEGLTTVSLRFGNPPWKDFGLYLRNNPMFFIERVETPVLLIHGDLDFVPIEQSEQFFSGLYRQGKRARFVRYWGEGHLLSSPQNVTDMWHRTFEWLDEFLKTDPKPR